MKKVVTIIIVVLLVLGFGYFLFKISPQQPTGGSPASQDNFDLSGVKSITQPAAVKADDRILGNVGAKNVFISYEDFECPACAAYSDILKKIPAEFQDTKYIYRYFPLTQIHKNAVSSAYAAEAAGEQGKYWEMHDLLFKKQAEWQGLDNPLDYFAGLAQQIGVANLDQFKSDITSKKFKNRIQEDLVESLSLNLQGTPTFFFNGHQLQNQELAGLKKQAESLYNK